MYFRRVLRGRQPVGRAARAGTWGGFMAGRRRDPTNSRADPAAALAAHPSRRQAAALLAALVVAAGVVAVLSYVIRPDRARAFDLFHGSVFLSDQLGPVAADLADGRPTLRLVNAN